MHARICAVSLTWVFVCSLCSAEILYGPWEFEDNAFADNADSLGLGPICPVPFDGPLDESEALSDFIPEWGLINIGTGSPEGSCANDYRLNFTDMLAVSGIGIEIIFFDARFSADAYECAVREAGAAVFTPFVFYDADEFINLNLPGPTFIDQLTKFEQESVIWALEIDLDDFGLPFGTQVDALRIRAVAAKAGADAEGDPVMAAVMPTEMGPPNNLCDNAQEIGLGSTAFTNIDAYTWGPPHDDCEFAGDDQVNSDVWFNYTAPCNGFLTVGTCDDADFNTKIAVYANNCSCDVSDITLIGCNDDGEDCLDGTAELEVFVFGGQCNQIRVGGFGDAQGTGTLNLSFESFFDNCHSADILDGVQGTINFCTTDSTTDGPAHAGCIGGGSELIHRDIWYDYISPCTGTLTVSTCDMTDVNTKIAMYDGVDCPVTDDALLACNDDGPGCSDGTSTVSAQVTAGNTYKVRLGGATASDHGEGQISFQCEGRGGGCAEDLDGDGVVGPADLAQLLGAWGSAPFGHPADLNFDGMVGPADLAQLLGAWGPCPGPPV